jgi:HSP20 family protein
MCVNCFTVTRSGLEDKTAASAPLADIVEQDDFFRINMDVPGFDKNEIKIRLDDSLLTISGESNYRPPAGFNIIYSETGSNKISRSFLLGKNLNSKKIRAEIKNGVLSVIIPKIEYKVFDIPISAN